MAPVQLATVTDDPVHGDVGKKSHFGLRDGRKFQVRYNEADVSFPIVSIGATIATGQLVRVWSGLSSDVATLEWRVPQDMCEGPKCGEIGETPRTVLVAMFGGTHGRSTVVPESQDSKVSC